MPKFKLGNVLSKVILGEARQELEEDDPGYLGASFERYIGESRNRATDDENADDGQSIISILTMETVDNQPGTGRFIDTYIYQPMGRRIERLAMRYTIASLHPARISQYIEAETTDYLPCFKNGLTLNDAIAGLCHSPKNGSTVYAGMKCLVKQTQSDAINRSTTALAALVRVSLTYYRKEIYVKMSRIEPIFHLETLAGSLPSSHPGKNWFLLLVKLARETVIAVKMPSVNISFDPVLGKAVLQLWPSSEIALDLRQRLIHAFEAYRYHGLDSLAGTLGEACAICSVAVSTSTCIEIYARGTAYMHILETVYFTAIFVLRSIDGLADFARITANGHIYMVLRTIACWMDAIVHRCLYSSAVNGRFYMDLLKHHIALRSLALVDDGTVHMLLPQSYNYARDLQSTVMAAFPRRHRQATEWYGHSTPPIQTLIEAAKRRTRRLLRSFDELEREVLERASENNSFTSQAKIDADPFWNYLDDFEEVWWKIWGCTLTRALRAQVPENDLTEEFREARRIGLYCDSAGRHWSARCDPGESSGCNPEGRERRLSILNWAYYKLRCHSRHKWGQYLRSNMDWDWDLGSCMNSLFKIEKRSQVGLTPVTQFPSTSGLEFDVDTGTEGTLKISMGEAQGSLLREIQIAYKTSSGETRYLTFTQPCTPGHLSVPESPFITEPSVLGSAGVKQDSSYRTGSSDGEQEVQDLETNASSSVASHFKEPKDTSVEESHNGYEGKDVGFDEVRVGGDAISICLPD